MSFSTLTFIIWALHNTIKRSFISTTIDFVANMNMYSLNVKTSFVLILHANLCAAQPSYIP